MVKTVPKELEMEITATYFWTDSEICLNWLKTKERLTAFVAARVSQIKENGHNLTMWNWVPSDLNVADMGTKASKFANMNDWINRPEFLYQSPEY